MRSINEKKEFTGREILSKYFLNMTIAELNFEKNYLTMDEEQMSKESPEWFKFL
jgi:hypothetical protein